MHTRTVEQVRTWDTRPFSGGLGTLYELAETDHTGAVVADDTWLFMLNGRVIGIFEGTMDDFESSGTVYTTPEDSIPLLFAMQEREGRTRAKYFTEDTPLEEADRTLTDANFTGYIELSENVLSGDYYLVYYGGTRRSVAFIGQSERVETGDAAFEKATEEVGLYEVLDVSMTITEIPEPREDATGAAVSGSDTEGAVAGTDTDVVAETDSPAESTGEIDSTGEPAVASAAGTTESEAADAGMDDPVSTESADEEAEQTAPDAVETEGVRSDEADSTGTDIDEVDSSAASTTDAHEPANGTETGNESAETSVTETNPEPQETSETAPSTGNRESVETAEPEQSSLTEGSAEQREKSDSELERMFRAEEQWRRSKAIPALDPDETEPTDAEESEPTAGNRTGAKSGASATSRTQQESGTGSEARRGTPSRPSPSSADRQATTEKESTVSDRRSGPTPSTAREQVEAELKKRESRIEDLENRLTTIERERSELEGELEDERANRSRLESELSELRSERDELATRVEELETAAAENGHGSDPGTTALSATDALAGTNLFVRYDSKSDPTLEALGPEVDSTAVNANLSLEHHTQFETTDVTVEGQQYRDFLESTGEFRFVNWVLRELPYELLETGNRNALSDLFEAISAIDRVEFDGSVTVDPESGTNRRFALVMRDRMGNPLLLGEYNEDRNPVRDEELETLLDGAREVAATVDSLAGAFYVTASFFEPAALERAEAAASSGGLFSRQEKASFVTPDSGTGFHLGLVEDRSQTFHVTVPKL